MPPKGRLERGFWLGFGAGIALACIVLAAALALSEILAGPLGI